MAVMPMQFAKTRKEPLFASVSKDSAEMVLFAEVSTQLVDFLLDKV